MVNFTQEYLKAAATPEYLFLTTEIMSLLEEKGYDNFTDTYDEVININSGLGATAVVDLLHEKNVSTLRTVAAEHGIQFVDEVNLSDMLVCIRALFDIQSYDNPGDIINTLSSNMGPEETLSELFSFVSSKEPEFFLPLFDEVTDTLISKIKELYTQSIPVIDHVNKDLYIDNLNKVCTLLGTKDLHTLTILIEGLDVGFAMKVYLDMLGNKLATLEPKRIAQELLCITQISSDIKDNPLKSVRDILPIYIHDELKYGAIDVEFNRLLLEYNR